MGYKYQYNPIEDSFDLVGSQVTPGVGLNHCVFKQTFTGNGSDTQFQLTDTENASFIEGSSWLNTRILNTFPSYATKSNKKALYDSLNIFTKNQITVSSINASGLVTLSHPPIDTEDFIIWYWYYLDEDDTIDDYYREDFITEMEGERPELTASDIAFSETQSVKEVIDGLEAVDHTQNTDTILLTGGSGGEELFNAGYLKTNLLTDDGINIQIDEIRARDGDGLKLYDDGGNGIFVEDGGNVGIGLNNPGSRFVVKLSDNLGADKFSLRDSGDVEVAHITSDGYGYFAGAVGIGGLSISKTILSLSSTTRGFLPPRMTAIQRNGITSPPEALIVYDITNNKLDFYDGSVWKAFVSTDISTFVVGSVPFATDAHHISDDNANLFWDNTLKRLGIGTNTPEWLLDVDGDLAGKKIIMNRGAVQSPYIMKGAGLPSKGMSFYTVDNHRMIIAENGKVGIGANAYPSEKLDVDGNIKISGNLTDGTNASSPADIKDAVDKKHTQNTDVKIIIGDTKIEVIDPGSALESYITFVEDNTEIMRISEGKVGIGTNTPNAKLNVESPTGGALTAGFENTASGQYSIALGWDCIASQKCAVAIGKGSQASSMWSTAIGYQALAQANYSVAIGMNSQANELYSMALGRNTVASGQCSTAIGYQNEASGDFSIALGRGIEAGADYVVAIALNDSSAVCSQANSMCIMGGKVGIETETPTEKLDVNGNIAVTGIVDGVDIAAHEHSGGFGETRLAAKDRRQFAVGEKHVADSAAGDTLSEHIVLQAQDALTITKIFFLPDASLTANDIDYARITVYRRDSSGGTQSMMATVTTTIADSGNWTAFDAVDFGAIAMPPQDKVAAGEVLTWEITKTASGVIVPAGTLQIEYTID